MTTRNVTVTTPHGNTNPVTFTVQGPTIAAISPNAGTRGSAPFTVTLTGTNLGTTTSVNLSGNGGTSPVARTNIVATAGTVTVTFTIPAGATPGARNVTVTTSTEGNSAVNPPATTFTVN